MRSWVILMTRTGLMPGLPDAGGVQEDDGEKVMQAVASLPSSLGADLRFVL